MVVSLLDYGFELMIVPPSKERARWCDSSFPATSEL